MIIYARKETWKNNIRPLKLVKGALVQAMHDRLWFSKHIYLFFFNSIGPKILI